MNVNDYYEYFRKSADKMGHDRVFNNTMGCLAECIQALSKYKENGSTTDVFASMAKVYFAFRQIRHLISYKTKDLTEDYIDSALACVADWLGDKEPMEIQRFGQGTIFIDTNTGVDLCIVQDTSFGMVELQQRIGSTVLNTLRISCGEMTECLTNFILQKADEDFNREVENELRRSRL